ncbi:flavodoxin domain-containing protein [Streptomyces sp. NPDC052225]|uniref:flavodoxin domain-containing protein n=1 Tax=Streptomyces sp. NPDC052225 TaxID=3154949 RepID=UPI00343145D5
MHTHDTRPRVLVAYGTKRGATADIAEQIADALKKTGCAAETRPAGEVRDLAEYDAVVLGGALYAGRWHRDTRRLARRTEKVLADRPVWLFSSGPLDDSATRRDIPAVPAVRRVADRVHARGHVTFGGCLTDDTRGRTARMIVKSGRGGDFRDADQIATWAAEIGRELTRT